MNEFGKHLDEPREIGKKKESPQGCKPTEQKVQLGKVHWWRNTYGTRPNIQKLGKEGFCPELQTNPHGIGGQANVGTEDGKYGWSVWRS